MQNVIEGCPRRSAGWHVIVTCHTSLLTWKLLLFVDFTHQALSEARQAAYIDALHEELRRLNTPSLGPFAWDSSWDSSFPARLRSYRPLAAGMGQSGPVEYHDTWQDALEILQPRQGLSVPEGIGLDGYESLMIYSLRSIGPGADRTLAKTAVNILPSAATLPDQQSGTRYHFKLDLRLCSNPFKIMRFFQFSPSLFRNQIRFYFNILSVLIISRVACDAVWCRIWAWILHDAEGCYGGPKRQWKCGKHHEMSGNMDLFIIIFQKETQVEISKKGKAGENEWWYPLPSIFELGIDCPLDLWVE